MSERDGTEFYCIECGTHVFCFAPTPEPPLCAACLFLPSWFKDAELRARLDPDHDGAGFFEPKELGPGG